MSWPIRPVVAATRRLAVGLLFFAFWFPYLPNTLPVCQAQELKNLYRNLDHGFSIQFPENWKWHREKNPHILVHGLSTDENLSISVYVHDVPSEVRKLRGDDDLDIDKLADAKSLVPKGATLISQGKTTLANEKALWVKYWMPFSSSGLNLIVLQYVIVTQHDFKLFTVSSGASGKTLSEASRTFAEQERSLLQSLTTFTFFK